MNNVINLSDHQAHLSGTTVCTACNFEWEIVAPVGTYDMECEKCGAFKGVFKYPVRRGEYRWYCDCGSKLFYINHEGPYCRECGEYATGF